YLAQRGTVMVTLNFRHAADGYPTSLADINYGIRWTKAHAKELKVNPDQVVIGGASSGGHLAMLVAMRPNDPRYAAIPGPAGDEPERFVSNYRKAGGDIEIAYFDNAKRNTDTTHVAVVDFMKKHLK